MKLRDTYYSQDGFINPKYTRNIWLKYKDRFCRWVASAYFQRVYGIKIRPKHRHRRSIRIRDIQLRFDLKSRLYEYTSKDKKAIRRLWIQEY